MNDRIRELARDCGIPMAHDQVMSLGYLDTKHRKFAESIIRECIVVCNQLQDVPASEPRHCAEDITIHFGLND